MAFYFSKTISVICRKHSQKTSKAFWLFVLKIHGKQAKSRFVTQNRNTIANAEP